MEGSFQVTILFIIVAMAACLRLLGRRWWCKCGQAMPWTGPGEMTNAGQVVACSAS